MTPDYMSEQEHRRIINLQRRLPDQIAAAKKRLEHLYLMAARVGMNELLECPDYANQAWDRVIKDALEKAR